MNVDLILEYWPALLEGLGRTVQLAAFVLLLSTLVAFGTAMAREYRVPVVGRFSAAFVNIFRALPALLTIYLTYYGLPQLGLPLKPMTAAILGMTLVNGAYLSEDVRAGLAAVNRGQYEASRALGMPQLHIIRRIVLPQALPVLLPPYMTTAIQAVKGTSVASLIGVNELTKISTGAMSITFSAVEFLAVAAALYLVLTGVLAGFQVFAERHISRHLRVPRAIQPQPVG